MSTKIDMIFEKLKDNKEFRNNLNSTADKDDIKLNAADLIYLLMRFSERLEFNIMYSEMVKERPELVTSEQRINEALLDNDICGTTGLYTAAWIASEEFNQQAT